MRGNIGREHLIILFVEVSLAEIMMVNRSIVKTHQELKKRDFGAVDTQKDIFVDLKIAENKRITYLTNTV